MSAARIVIREDPLNAETPLTGADGIVTPDGRHYVRSHFPLPHYPGTVTVDGAVRRARTWSVAELHARAEAAILVTLECAGNGRRFLDPPAPGEAWGLGAVGTAEWTGVPLGELMAEVGVAPDAVELLFEGADSGVPGGERQSIAFQRSLPLPAPASAIVAVAMNGRPMAPEHGAPVRLVVPGRYGVASVKWLTRITALREPFDGFFQVKRYVVDGEPIGPIEPRAVIVAPAGDAVVAGKTVVRGYAWSGHGPIARVELSADGGQSWRDAELGPQPSPFAWRTFSATWLPGGSGRVALLARATDAAGKAQPLAQVWNALGYQNNAAQPVWVTVE